MKKNMGGEMNSWLARLRLTLVQYAVVLEQRLVERAWRLAFFTAAARRHSRHLPPLCVTLSTSPVIRHCGMPLLLLLPSGSRRTPALFTPTTHRWHRGICHLFYQYLALTSPALPLPYACAPYITFWVTYTADAGTGYQTFSIQSSRLVRTHLPEPCM